jgi:hypothetical protein
MYSFWGNIYDDVKDRRYGGLFFSTLLALFGSLGIMALIGALTNGVGLVPALFVFAVPAAIALVCAVSNFVRAWKRRDVSLNSAALSRDELAKARSKLKKETKAAAFRTQRRPARLVITRVPDTDLKY